MQTQRDIEIRVGDATLYGDLGVPTRCRGIVVFAHGSGSSRHSPRNQMVAKFLRDGGLGTLLFDLLTGAEERIDLQTAQYRFDVDFLAQRLVTVIDWLVETHAPEQPLGLFGSSTGAAAALIAATETPHAIAAVVSRGGRPDLAQRVLAQVVSPTLLIVGGLDAQVLELNGAALEALQCEKRLVVIKGATHLFPEPGALEQVCEHAREWFLAHA